MSVRIVFLSLIAALTAACGNQIGDSCFLSTDCDPNGNRICDGSQPDGYCTIVGCDYNTCPSESVCVEFFNGSFANKPCNPQTEDFPGGTDDCSFDEVCTLAGQCAPSSSEVRYCEKKCSSDGDCRSQYECRDETKMIEHGGETVLAPGDPPGTDLQAFCAPAPQ
jgi:hypothetical protein